MKKAIGMTLIIISFLLFKANVKAFDEYGIVIKANNSVTLINALTNTTITPTDNTKYNYTNSVLTLSSNIHYAYIKAYKPITITSNDEKVYVDYMYGINSSLVIDHLKSETYDTEVEDSLVGVHYSNTGKPWYSGIYANGLTITNSDLYLNNKATKNDDLIQTVDYDMLINNSTIYTSSGFVSKNVNITVTNSTIKAPKIEVSPINNTDYKNITLTNVTYEGVRDTFEEYLYTGVSTQGTLNVNNSTMNGIDYIDARDITFKDSKLNESKYDETNSIILGSNNFTVTNSYIKTKSSLLANNLVLNDSTIIVETSGYDRMKELYNYDYSTNSSIIVYENFEINGNTSLNIKSTRNVPALFLINKPTFENPNLVFTDGNTVLDLKEVTDMDKMLNGEDDGYNKMIIDSLSLQKVYTVVDSSGEPLKNIYTTEGVKYTFKVKNGTWEDGTEEIKEKFYLKGQTPDKTAFSTLTSNEGYVMEFLKTGDNEYTYVYKELINPKTGVRSLIILLIISIGAIYLISKNKNKYSMFRRI